MISRRFGALLAVALTACGGSTSSGGAAGAAGSSGGSGGGSAGSGGGSAGSGGGSAGSAGTGTAGSAGTAGGTGILPECTSDDQCQLLSDCCSCIAYGPDEPAPPQCDAACSVDKCTTLGASPATVRCTAGRCVAGIECDQNQALCESLPPQCPVGRDPERGGRLLGSLREPAAMRAGDQLRRLQGCADHLCHLGGPSGAHPALRHHPEGLRGPADVRVHGGQRVHAALQRLRGTVRRHGLGLQLPQLLSPVKLSALYQDEHVLVVDKPSGLAVHRGWAQDRVTAVGLARRLAGRSVSPVHRLDRGTSGVLLFAFDAETIRTLQASLAEGAHRVYLALVRGPAPEHIVVDHPIPRRPGGPRVDAVTEVRLLGRFERYSLVEARPRTGRLHQVRRHLKHLSLPIIGDSKYGKSEHNRLLRERFGLARLALHALRLECAHPARSEPLSVTAPVPEDLAGPFRAMGLDF